jgi:hypothetical protein
MAAVANNNNNSLCAAAIEVTRESGGLNYDSVALDKRKVMPL